MSVGVCFVAWHVVVLCSPLFAFGLIHEEFSEWDGGAMRSAWREAQERGLELLWRA
jgi:hypothetical protein